MDNSAVTPVSALIDAFDGAVTSALAAWLSTRSMEGWQKQAIVIAVAVVMSFIRCYLTGQFKAESITASIIIVLTAAWGAYKTFLSALVPHLQTVGPIKDSTEPGEIPANITQGELK